ncbi:MAG: hypothetical protein LC126_04450 [Bryobacterales bacterium]|nr:hypothetical protein [Bryobacterales bacterium]
MMKHRTIAVFFAAALPGGAGARQAFGHCAATGSISGRVTDPADAAVPNAIRFLQPGRFTGIVPAQGPALIIPAAGAAPANLPRQVQLAGRVIS